VTTVVSHQKSTTTFCAIACDAHTQQLIQSKGWLSRKKCAFRRPVVSDFFHKSTLNEWRLSYRHHLVPTLIESRQHSSTVTTSSSSALQQLQQ
jgi:hypothetical protein